MSAALATPALKSKNAALPKRSFFIPSPNFSRQAARFRRPFT
jgi:hypothetical protein